MGEAFWLQLEFLCLQLSFFAYSPLRGACQTHFPNVSEKASIVSKKAPKHSCKQKSSNASL